MIFLPFNERFCSPFVVSETKNHFPTLRGPQFALFLNKLRLRPPFSVLPTAGKKEPYFNLRLDQRSVSLGKAETKRNIRTSEVRTETEESEA
ncbi:MAG: hypothetical protein ACTS6G_03875 [Candidatus Hodgkinia cicadicola]